MVRIISILLFFSTSLQAQFFYTKDYSNDYQNVRTYCRNNSVSQPSWSDARRIDQMIRNLIENDDWQELDGFHWLPSGSEAFAKINFIDTSFVATASGSEGTDYDWSESNGLKQLTTSGYWSLNWDASNYGDDFTQNSAMLFVYCEGTATLSNEATFIMANSKSVIYWLNKGVIGPSYNVNATSGAYYSESYPTSHFSYMAKRTDSSYIYLYKDGNQVDYDLKSSISLSSDDFKIFGGTSVLADYIRCVAWGSKEVDPADFDDQVKACFSDLTN